MSESIGRSLYVCTTPFQIMTCISKVLTDKEEADLLVDPQFCDAESIMERLRQEHIFRRVINTGESKRLCSIRKKEGLVRKLSLSVALVGEGAYIEIFFRGRNNTVVYMPAATMKLLGT